MFPENKGKAFPLNSIGFAYHRLGLTPKEVRIEPWNACLEDNFVKVKDWRDADVIATFRSQSGRLAHLAILSEDKKTVDYLEFKKDNRKVVTSENMLDFLLNHQSPTLKVQFLKLK